MALGATLAPRLQSSGTLTNGTIGPAITYPTFVTLASSWHSNGLTGYVLSYSVNGAKPITSSRTYNLTRGWNTLTVAVGGLPHALFVYGGS
jgi:hypothetical protein